MTIPTLKRQLKKFGIEFNDANDLLDQMAKLPIGRNPELYYLLDCAFKLSAKQFTH